MHTCAHACSDTYTFLAPQSLCVHRSLCVCAPACVWTCVQVLNELHVDILDYIERTAAPKDAASAPNRKPLSRWEDPGSTS